MMTKLSWWEEPDYILVPVGGGGLISGIAGCIKSRCRNTKIVGCQPENDNAMEQCIEKDLIFDIEVSEPDEIIHFQAKPTLSDGTAGNIEPDSITFRICKEYGLFWFLSLRPTVKQCWWILFGEREWNSRRDIGCTRCASQGDRRCCWLWYCYVVEGIYLGHALLITRKTSGRINFRIPR